ncbi:hypothetical protein CR513_58932, partial [Mucuna pruriens]
MTNKGTSDGRRPPNRGRGRGVSRRGQPTINSPTSINHISTSESTIPIHQHAILPIVEEEPQSIKVGDIVVRPSTLQDSFTPEGPSPHSEHTVDQRPFLQVIGNEFIPSHSLAHVISRNIKQKFDTHGRVGRRYGLKFMTCGLESLRWDPSEEQTTKVIFKKKGSRIYKNTMNKIRNGHDRATWIPPSVRTILDEHWASTDFQNKRSIAKANRAIDKGASTYCGGSISTSAHYEKMEVTFGNDSNSVPINDNDIYLEVVWGKNEKGNIYGLGKLTNKFMYSTRIPTNLIDMLMVQQMEEMHETIHKLNNELEKSLEEKVVQFLHNHEEQSEQIRQQNEKNGTTTSTNGTTKSTNATYFTTLAVEISYVLPHYTR